MPIWAGGAGPPISRCSRSPSAPPSRHSLLTDNLAIGKRQPNEPIFRLACRGGHRREPAGLRALRSAFIHGAATAFAVDRKVKGRLQRGHLLRRYRHRRPTWPRRGSWRRPVIDAGTDAFDERRSMRCALAGTVSVVGVHIFSRFPPALDVPAAKHHAANDHGTGTTNLAGTDPCCCRPTRCRWHSSPPRRWTKQARAMQPRGRAWVRAKVLLTP